MRKCVAWALVAVIVFQPVVSRGASVQICWSWFGDSTQWLSGFRAYYGKAYRIGATVVAINCGGSAYTASDGTQYQADAYYSGGRTAIQSVAIDGTEDDAIYRSERFDESLTYHIPITNGEYSVTLKFAELYYYSSGSRRFNVSAEGTQVLSNVDIFASAGGKYKAFDATIVANVTDGYLDLVFTNIAGGAKVDGIQVNELIRSGTTVAAINCGGSAYTASDGTQYQADAYYSGGRTAIQSVAIDGTEDDAIYQSQRYDTSLTYRIPVPNGEYSVTLKFAELYYYSSGSRRFNVSAEGTQVLSNVDIFASAGGKYKAYDFTFPANVSDGYLDLSFTNIASGPVVGGILVRTGSGSGMTFKDLGNPAAQAVAAINCGGSAYTASDGTQYAADAYFSGDGSARSVDYDIGGTADQLIYRSERFGEFSYAIPVPNGDYVVKLAFAENYWSEAGKRVFNVSVEGQGALSGLDVYSKVGDRMAYWITLPATVADQVLNLDFGSVADHAHVMGIAVYPKQCGTIDGLNPGTNYCFNMTSYGENGVESVHTDEVCYTLPAEVGVVQRPESVSASALSPTSVRISWMPPSSGPTPSAYGIRYSGIDLQFASSPAYVSGLLGSTMYVFQLFSVGTDGTTSSAVTLNVRTPDARTSSRVGGRFSGGHLIGTQQE